MGCLLLSGGAFSELTKASQSPAHHGGYLQLLGVGGEGLHPPRGRGATQQQGEAGELPGRAGDVQALQRVQVELPDLDRCCQPGVPVHGQTDRLTTHHGSQRSPPFWGPATYV